MCIFHCLTFMWDSGRIMIRVIKFQWNEFGVGWAEPGWPQGPRSVGELRPTVSPPHSATSPLATPASPSAPVSAVSEFTVVLRSKTLHKAAECCQLSITLGHGPCIYNTVANSRCVLWPANISQKWSELPHPPVHLSTCCQIADGKDVSPLPQLVNYKIQGWWSAEPRCNHFP